MTIDNTRSWLRTGYDRPAPWGASLPDLWLDATLHFTRTGSSDTAVVDNGIGGFTAQADEPVEFLVCAGHAELVTESGAQAGMGLGDTQRRYYALLINPPTDVSLMPRKGDRVSFVDALGRTIDIGVARVDVPEGVDDHVEIDTEEYE